MALSCGLTQSWGRQKTCGYALNKIVDLYFINLEDVTGVTYNETVEGAGTQVTGFGYKEEATANWYHLAPATDSASISDALNVGDSGIRYRTHSVSFSLGGDYTPAAVEILHGLSVGEFVTVAKMANGKYTLLGSEAVGLKATAASMQGAATATAFSGMQFEMSCAITRESAPLSDAAVEAMLAKVNEPKDEATI